MAAPHSNVPFVPVANEFLAHWAAVDGALPPGKPLVLRGGVDRAELASRKTALILAHAGVRTELLGRRLAAETARRLRAPLLEVLARLKDVVLEYFPGEPLALAFPKAPLATAGLTRFLDPMLVALRLWTRMEEEPPPAALVWPLSLPVTVPPLAGLPPEEGVDRARLAATVAALWETYAAGREAGVSLLLARAGRDRAKRSLYAALLDYRKTVPTRLPAGEVLLETLPRLNPPSKRRKPRESEAAPTAP